jgi:hypothetical protein
MFYEIKKFTGRKTKKQKSIIQGAVNILSELGIPIENFTSRQVRRVERLGLVLLALGDLKPHMEWSEIKSKDDQISLTTRDIIKFLNANYSEKIADSSYDDFKREEIDQLILDGIVVPGFDRSATNDSRSAYSLCPTHAKAIRNYGTQNWPVSVEEIKNIKTSLREKISTARRLSLVPVSLPSGVELNFSSGKHNVLQKSIIEKLLPFYGYGAEVLYVGDTTNKYLFVARGRLKELSIPEPEHDELPDIVAFSESKKWVYLIEAVTSSGEIDPIRKKELEILTKYCPFPVVYITAFLTRDDYRKFAAKIAWETEVWIASDPEHLIHLNGDKFLGPYKEEKKT